MRVLVTGASGLIGRALIERLRAVGDEPIAWGRSELRPEDLAGIDAVVNLAGEPVLGKPWTPGRRWALRTSRVDRTERLIAAMASAAPRPRVLVSASAVGYYGDRRTQRLDEDSAPGEDFLAHLCRDWEVAALQAVALGVRTVILRTGLVLAPTGGALAPMRLPFRLGLGGPLGSGQQFWPWIHLRDEVEVIVTALRDDSLRGPVNAVAPEDATNAQFAHALGRALHRPAVVPLPGFLLQTVLDGAAAVLLSSQRVAPRVLGAHNFRFRFPELEAALRDCLRQDL